MNYCGAPDAGGSQVRRFVRPGYSTAPALASPFSLVHLARKEGARPSRSKGFEVAQVWDDLRAKQADGAQEIFLCQVAEIEFPKEGVEHA